MDPLAQLQDIHPPAPIHDYPIAIGWWILLALVILAVILATRWAIKKRKLAKAKKQALLEIDNCQSMPQLMQTLKWACLQYFPREQVANLSGQQYLAFLTQSTPEKHQQTVTDKFKVLIEAQYQLQAATQLTEAKQSVKEWISLALPPKAPNKKQGAL